MDEVRGARDAARWWAELTASERRRRLLTLKHHLVAETDHLVDLICTETGKPAHDALVEVVLSVTHLDWAARHAASVLRRRTVWPGLLGANQRASVGREPYGVVAVIGPWNYPLFTPTGSIWYALAVGNAVVFKPSEHTPEVGKLLAKLWWRTVPEQPVLQVVTGDGAVAEELIEAGVDKIAFTGSTRTAATVMALAARTLTPVVLECGGKDAMLVAADADLTAAARSAAHAAFSNAGQTCVGIKRVYVADAVADDFLVALDAALDGVRPPTAYGPMVLADGPAQIEDQVVDALSRGATVRHGVRPRGDQNDPARDNSAQDDSAEDNHRWVDPVVLVDVDEQARAVTDETFGPLLVVNRVADLAEAVRRANAVRFGLGASVFTRDRAAARRAAADLRCGVVMINSALDFMAVPALPFGGRGDSGFGRIHGADGLREFSQAKSVSRQLVPLPLDVMTLRPTRATGEQLRRILRLRHR